MARYLPLDMVRPGDLCLTAEPTIRSRLLRLSMWSKFSHAAIAIHPLIWFESIGSGVGYRLIEPCVIWDGNRVRLATKVDDGKQVVIKRPSGIFDEAETELERHKRAKSLMEISGLYAFLDYARLEDFLSMAAFGIGEKAVVKDIQEALRFGRDTIFDGPSCATLATLCYQDLGFELDVASERATPGILARSNRFSSLAEPIEADLIEGIPHWADIFEQITRSMDVAKAAIFATSKAAQTTKRGKELFDQFQWAMLAKKAYSNPENSKQSNDYSRRIRETFLADFAIFRDAAVQQLSPVYWSLSLMTDNLGSLSECAFQCKKQVARPEDTFCSDAGWCIAHRLDSTALEAVFS